MIKLIQARNTRTNELLIGHLEYSKEWGENLFYELDGDAFFEHEITIIKDDDDRRFPTNERRHADARQGTT